MKRFVIVASVLLGILALCTATPLLCAQASSSTGTAAAHKSSTAKKKRHYKRRGPVQMAPTPDRIMEIQSALARNGCYQGDPSGKWDAATVGAMQKFQGDHGLDATGKIDALSLQKLGLGSDIAGVSAPRPITPPAAKPAPAGAAPTTAKPATPAPSDTAGATATANKLQTSAAGIPAASASSASSSKPTAPPQPQ